MKLFYGNFGVLEAEVFNVDALLVEFNFYSSSIIKLEILFLLLWVSSSFVNVNLVEKKLLLLSILASLAELCFTSSSLLVTLEFPLKASLWKFEKFFYYELLRFMLMFLLAIESSE